MEEVIQLRVAIINQQTVNSIIEEEWDELLDFLRAIQPDDCPFEQFLANNQITKPTLKSVVKECADVYVEKLDWDKEKMANCAVSTVIAARILFHVFKQLSEEGLKIDEKVLFAPYSAPFQRFM